jgi:predicted ester cyclase
VTGITIARVKDGKIVESWNNWDALGMMRQLGAIPRDAINRAA